MSHKNTGKGPTYGEFSFPKGEVTYVRGYARGGKVSQPKAAKGMKAGGMAARMDAKMSPKVDMPPKSMNPKARMAPRFAKGGMVHPDLAEDKALIKKAFGMHDTQLHESKRTDLSKLKGGGMATKKYASGGAVKKYASGGAVPDKAMTSGMAAGAMAGGLGKAMGSMKPMKKGAMGMKKGGKC